MKILVAGAGGYIGIPLVTALMNRGHSVTALDRYFFGVIPPSPATIVRGDIRTIYNGKLHKLPGGYEGDDITVSIENMVDFSMFDAVIDLAGLSNDASAEIDPALTQSINVDGGKRLARIAKDAGVKRYVYSSSASIYGHGERAGLAEHDAANPLTDYAKSKRTVENYLKEITDKNFKPTILRNATVFGVAPRMRFDLAVNIMTYRAMKENLVYLMGGGDQWRPFISVADVVKVMCAAVEAPAEQVAGQTFNVGSDELNMKIGDLAKLVARRFPFAKVHNVPDGPDLRSYSLSFGKLRTWYTEPMASVESGIAEVEVAINDGTVDGADPRTVTLGWYKALMNWEKTLNDIRLDGKIL